MMKASTGITRQALAAIKGPARKHRDIALRNRMLYGKRYPRRTRLGLIEATTEALIMFFLSCVSEAYAPRPH